MKKKNLLKAMLCLMMLSSMIFAEKIIRSDVNEKPILGRSLQTINSAKFKITYPEIIQFTSQMVFVITSSDFNFEVFESITLDNTPILEKNNALRAPGDNSYEIPNDFSCLILSVTITRETDNKISIKEQSNDNPKVLGSLFKMEISKSFNLLQDDYELEVKLIKSTPNSPSVKLEGKPCNGSSSFICQLTANNNPSKYTISYTDDEDGNVEHNIIYTVYTYTDKCVRHNNGGLIYKIKAPAKESHTFNLALNTNLVEGTYSENDQFIAFEFTGLSNGKYTLKFTRNTDELIFTDFITLIISNTYSINKTQFIGQAATPFLTFEFYSTPSADNLNKCILKYETSLSISSTCNAPNESKIVCPFTLSDTFANIYTYQLETYDICGLIMTENIQLIPNSIASITEKEKLITNSASLTIEMTHKLPPIPTVVLTSTSLNQVKTITITSPELVSETNNLMITLPTDAEATIVEDKYKLKITNNVNIIEAVDVNYIFLYRAIAFSNDNQYVLKDTLFTSIIIKLTDAIHKNRVTKIKNGDTEITTKYDDSINELTMIDTELTFDTTGTITLNVVDAMKSENPQIDYSVKVISFTIGTPIIFLDVSENKKAQIVFTPGISLTEYNKMTAKQLEETIVFTMSGTGELTNVDLNYINDVENPNTVWGKFTEVTFSNDDKQANVLTSPLSLIIIKNELKPQFDTTTIVIKYLDSNIIKYKIKTIVPEPDNDSQYLYEEYFTNNKITVISTSGATCVFTSSGLDKVVEVELSCTYSEQPSTPETITITSFDLSAFVIPITFTECDTATQEWNDIRKVCECKETGKLVNDNGTCKASCEATENIVTICICPSGKGLAKANDASPYSCIDHKIESLSPDKIFISDFPYSIDITFNAMIYSTDVSKFTLTKKTTTFEDITVPQDGIIATQCQISGNSLKYTCPGLIFSGYAKDTYVFSWNSNPLEKGKEIIFDYSLEYAAFDSGHLISDADSFLIVTYLGPLHSETTYKLYDIEKKEATGENLESAIQTGKKQVKLTIPGSVTEGKYSILTTSKVPEAYHNNDQKGILFYKSVLAFPDGFTSTMNVFHNEPFKIIITFKASIFNDRITITYTDPKSASKTATYAIDKATPSQITISGEEATFATAGDYSFTITDKAVPSTSLSYKVTVKTPLGKPTLSDNSVFYYTDDTSISTITFIEEEVDATMFKKIKALKDKGLGTKKEVDFELVTVQGSLNAFTLKITTTMTADLWGKYDSLEIFGIDETTGLYSLTPFIIINANTIPKSFLTAYQNGVFVSKQLRTIEVHFEQEIYTEYFAGSTPRLSIEGHTLGVKTGDGNEKIMTIEKTTENTYFSTEKILLKRTESTVLEISIILCPELQAPASNKCDPCTGANSYFHFDKGTCVADCTSLLAFEEKKACYSDCADVVIDPVGDGPAGNAYKEEQTCVNECSALFGLNTEKTECSGIAIDNVSTSLFGETIAQIFDINFNVEVNADKVKGFGLYALPTLSTEIKLTGCDYKIHDTIKNVFECTSDINVAKGEYNLYWYPNESKSQTGFKAITLKDATVKKITVVTLSKIIELSSTQSEFVITYGGDFLVNDYTIELVNIVSGKSNIVISTDNDYVITAVKEVVTIKMPAAFSSEGEYMILTTHSASTETIKPSTTSTQTIMIYKAGITLQKEVSYIPKNSELKLIPIVFSSFLFKSRIVSVTYQKTDDANPTTIDSAEYDLSDDGLTLNIKNDDSAISSASDTEYKFVIKLKTITDNTPAILKYTIKVFTYPTIVTFIDPILEAKADNFIKVTFDAEVINPSIFKSIKTADATNVITFTLGEIIPSTSEPPTFDYKLLLNDLATAPEEKKYTGGIQFYDTKDSPLQTLLTTQKTLIVVKDSKYPKTIVPATLLIAENELKATFKFGNTEVVYPEYFIQYDNKSAKIFMSTPDTIILVYDDGKEEITATNTVAITETLQLSSFGTPIEIPVTVCSAPKLITNGECKLCSEIDKTKPYYGVDGKCINECPVVYLDFVCHPDCPAIEGKQYYAKDSKECVETCPEGQTGKDKVCVDITIITITAITSPIYAMTTPQPITITTDPVENFKGGFKLQQVDGTFKKDITCPYEEGSKINHVCPVDTWAQVPAGDYKIIWGEALPDLDSEGYAFSIIDKSLESITLDLISDELGKLPTGDNTVDFTLTYLGNYALATTTIELINVDTEAKVSIPKESITAVADNLKQITLKLKSSIPEGTYYISTSASGKTVTSTKSFTVYLEDTIALSTDGKEYEVDVLLKNEAIAFSKAVFPSRIEKVEIGSTMTTFKFEGGKLIIQNTITVVNGSTVIKITYKTLFSTKFVTYTITSKDSTSTIIYPEKATIEDKIYYHGMSPIYLKVTFNIAVTQVNSFSSIQTAEKNIKFRMEPLDDKNLDFKLILVDPSIETTWGKYTAIKFYAKTADGNERMIISAEGDFKILNAFNIPLTLINDKIAFEKTANNNTKKDFDLIFKETVEEDYPKHLSLAKNDYDCTMAYQSSSPQTFKVTCLKPILDTISFTISSFDQTIKFPVEVTKCGTKPEINGGCVTVCPEDKKYLDNGECLKTCPVGRIPDGNKCHKSCKTITGKELYYFDVTDSKCTEGCSKFRYVNEKRCYNACPKKFNEINLYINGFECRENCPENYISDAEGKCIEMKPTTKCLNSDVKIKCITQCPYGTYFSNEKNNCVYDSTTTNTSTNTCKAEFCKNEGTCSIVNNKPVCSCKEGTFGSSCQNIKEKTTSIIDYVEEEFKNIHNKEETVIELSHPKSISIIVELTTVITKEKDAISKVDPTDLISMSTKLIKTLETSISGNISQKDAIPFLSFNIKALILKLKEKKSTRNLAVDENIPPMEKNLQDLVDKFLKSTATTELMQGDLNSKVSKLIEDDGESFKAQLYTQDTQSLSVSTSQAQQHNLTTIDVSNIATQANIASYGVVKIDLTSDYQQALGQTGQTRRTAETTIQQNSMRFAIVDLNSRSIVDLTSIDATYFSIIPSSSINGDIIDTEKYNYFMQRDIDIHNPDDKVFAEPCYYNWELEYDLPQKYRYNDLYSGKTLESANDNCKYKGYDTGKNSIILECSTGDNFGDVVLVTKEIALPLPSDKNHVDNLPTLCGGSIAAIENNFGFWTYLWVFIIGLIATIMLGVMYLSSMSKGHIQSWIASDEMAPGYTKTAVKTEEVAQETDVKLDFTANKSFGQLILYNFRTVHPLTTVCRGSVVTPLMLKISILMYNIFNLFGFNALYYNEDMIGKKMDDTNRDNFGYPMKSEFHKIVYSLLTSMALTMIVRAITLVTMGKKEELTKQLDSAQSIDEKQGLCKAFWMGGIIQRIIAYIFMLALSIFFFYYCVVFCGIYVNTQYGWFYSGLWSLFMDWVVFAPVSILIITGVESISPACGYYAKQLFWF